MSPRRRAETPPPPDLTRWVDRHRELIAGVVASQRRAVVDLIVAGAMPEAVWDAEKWDTELINLLTGLALTMSPELARPIAEAFGIVHDEDEAAAFLRVNARYAALSFNAATLEALNATIAEIHNNPDVDDGPISLRARLGLTKEDLPGPDLGLSTRAARKRLRLAADEVLTDAQVRRAGFLADERAAIIANYSRNEAARRGGARTKTWITPHPRPRPSHARLDNVTIPFEDVFANGGRYPRDATLPAGERAGCTCHITYTSDGPTAEPRPADDPVAHPGQVPPDAPPAYREALAERIAEDEGISPEAAYQRVLMLIEDARDQAETPKKRPGPSRLPDKEVRHP